MSEQIGFDFGSEQPVTGEGRHGDWHDPQHMNGEWLALVKRAETDVQRVIGPARTLFAAHIAAALQHYGTREVEDAVEEETTWRIRCFEASHEQIQSFFALCFTCKGTKHIGIEYKTAACALVKTAAMYVENVGTLIAREWSSDNSGLLFHPWRDHFFKPSYKDDSARLPVPAKIWKGAYCGDKLAYAGKGVASVPTFILNGRDYVHTGNSSGRGIHEATSWNVVPLTEWKSQTYSYESQRRAWDDGRLERGNQRGLIVKIRGHLCVFESAITVFEEYDPAAHVSYFDEEQTDDESELEQLEDEPMSV